MLVLTRHKNESIMLAGGTIEVVLLEIRGDKVRIGIDAPANVDVHRKEVWEAIQRQEKAEGGRRKAEQTDDAAASDLEPATGHSPLAPRGAAAPEAD